MSVREQAWGGAKQKNMEARDLTTISRDLSAKIDAQRQLLADIEALGEGPERTGKIAAFNRNKDAMRELATKEVLAQMRTYEPQAFEKVRVELARLKTRAQQVFGDAG
jgi:hypothetical protein